MKVKYVIILLTFFFCFSFSIFADDNLALHSPQVVTRESMFRDKRGFKYGTSMQLEYNLIQMESSNNADLFFHQMQIEQDFFIGYNFNGWSAMYIKTGFNVDVVSTNSGLYTLKNRFSVYGKLGPRFYISKWLFLDSAFVVGRSMYRSNWNHYTTLGCDIALGFDILATKRLTISLQPLFAYRRTSYSNEFVFGVVYAIEA